MSTNVWTGGGDGTTFTSAANWTDTPSSNDTFVIASTSSTITGGATGYTGCTVRIGPGFTGTIGSAAVPLDLNGGVFDFESNGASCYVSGDWTTVQVNGGAGSSSWLTWVDDGGTYQTSMGTLRVLAGTGTVTVQDGAAVTNAEVISAPGVVLVLGSIGTVTSFTMNSGLAQTTCAYTTCEVRGGTLEMTGSGGAITTLEVTGTGRVIHEAGGTIGTLNGYAGQFDGRENPNSSVTVTNCTIWDCDVNVQSGLRNYIFTNPVSIQGDGTLRVSLGQTLAVA